MTYWNLTFLIIFLPLTIIIYNILPQKHRWKVLLIASYIFFWSISGKLLIYLLATTLLIHDFGLWFMSNQNERDLKLKNAEKEKKKEIKEYYLSKERKGLILTIIVLVGILVILKYSTFLGTNINSLFKALNLSIELKISKFIVPIGISFYTLQAISYIMDVYKGKIEADKSLGRLALYLSFFPQIMEGPICRYSETAESLWKGEKTTYKNLTFGLQRMLFGIMKKMVIADRLNLFIIEVFTNYAKYDGGIVFIGMILYTLQLYMDFSGTMDIALGIGEIFGVKLPENFRQPFFSKSISEFWTRWHITLGAWFRDYVYYPVCLTDKCKKATSKLRKKFGNYYGPLLVTSIALFSVWSLNGVWHGDAWSYIFFGMYHFVLILSGRFIEPIAEKVYKKLHINSKCLMVRIFQMLRTAFLVFVGELFFRANGLKAGIEMFKEMICNFSLKLINDGTIFTLKLDRHDCLIIVITLIAIFIVSLLKEKGINIRENISKKNVVIRWSIYYLLIIAIILFGAYGARI